MRNHIFGIPCFYCQLLNPGIAQEGSVLGSSGGTQIPHLLLNWIEITTLPIYLPLLLMVEVGSLSHFFGRCIHPRWLFGISSINRMSQTCFLVSASWWNFFAIFWWWSHRCSIRGKHKLLSIPVSQRRCVSPGNKSPKIPWIFKAQQNSPVKSVQLVSVSHDVPSVCFSFFGCTLWMEN